MGIQKADPISKGYDDLISEINKGTIQIPKFQREFVWSVDKTAKLLDSIVKNYPVGTFILWQTNTTMNAVKELGGQILDRPEDGTPVGYVLDGQQRITSLYAAYKGLQITKHGETKVTDYSKIYIDLEKDIDTDEQIIIPIEGIPGENFISLNEVLNFTDNANMIKEKYDEYFAKISEYYNTFKQYRFSAILFKDDNIDAAIEVFTRINTGGQTLTLFEIMCAKTYDESRNFDMRKEWEKFNVGLEKINYEGISSSVLLNLLALLLGGTKECKRGTILKLGKEDIITNWKEMISALEWSIEYFHLSYEIPVSRLLPYDTLLVPFAYFIYRNEWREPNGGQRKELEEFFWRASLTQRYSGSTDTALSQDIQKIEKILDGMRPDYSEMKLFLDPKKLIDMHFRAGKSDNKAILCLFARQGPKDFFDNKKVVLNNAYLKVAHSKNYHHFFPKHYLREAGEKNMNSIMNITFISDETNKRRIGTKPPSEYIAEFEKENDKIQETLESHFIGFENFGIIDNNYKQFLKKRAKLVFDELKSKIQFSAEETATDATVYTLIANGETDKVEFKSSLRFDFETQKVNKGLEFAVLRTIAAFMNTRGGHLIIGVKDNKEILGLDADINTFETNTLDQFRRHFIQLFNNSIGADNNFHINLTSPDIDGEKICVVEVQPTEGPSVIIKDKEGNEYYFVRSDSTTIYLGREEQSKHERKRWGMLATQSDDDDESME